LPEEEEPPPAEVPVQKAKEKPTEKVQTSKEKAAPVEKKVAPVTTNSKVVKQKPSVAVVDEVMTDAEPEAETAENVDDLLAAVEAMRAKRPGLRARKLAPSAEEMNRRRLQLRETVGRILASL
jgi:hypothetical protein